MAVHPIGTIVRLKVPLLGNPAGALGVCYETYTLGTRGGSSFIFENGDYDGFSANEQDEFLEFVEASSFRYSFTNVLKLSNDFSNGLFDAVLKNTTRR